MMKYEDDDNDDGWGEPSHIQNIRQWLPVRGAAAAAAVPGALTGSEGRGGGGGGGGEVPTRSLQSY